MISQSNVMSILISVRHIIQPPVIPHAWGSWKNLGDTPSSPGRKNPAPLLIIGGEIAVEIGQPP
jgi:hypothetical protein